MLCFEIKPLSVFGNASEIHNLHLSPAEPLHEMEEQEEEQEQHFCRKQSCSSDSRRNRDEKPFKKRFFDGLGNSLMMMTANAKKVCVYVNASELAQACGRNPYRSVDKLLDKYKHRKVEEKPAQIIQRNIRSLSDSAVKRTCDELENKDDSELGKLCKRFRKEKPALSDREALNNVLAAGLSEAEKTSSTKKALEISTGLRTAMVKGGGLGSEMCQAITSQVSTSRGNHFEKQDILRACGKKVQSFQSKMVFCTILKGSNFYVRMGGKCDAKLCDGVVVESKRRMYRLLGVRDYEKIQCFAYMRLFKCDKCLLTETFGEQQVQHEIKWDPEFWETILCDLKQHYVSLFVTVS